MKEALESVCLFVLLSFVVYRLARLITLDDGPFDLLLKLRALWGAYDYGPNGVAKTNLGRGLTCPYCIGFWIAGITALVAYGFMPGVVAYWLALAGAQSFLQSLGRQ